MNHKAESLTSLKTLKSVRAYSQLCKKQGKRVALVPTMGALHTGHLSLVALAKLHAEVVIVSIFVNPTQFGVGEDFDAYPRPIEADRSACLAAGVDALYLPSAAQMYPQGFATTVSVDSALTGQLCGAHRPGHFDGVSTVVAKLLIQSAADIAVFGEKDYQQLCVIRRMAADLNLPTEILGAPIARAADGLALSSRNQYLSAEERRIAPLLYAQLRALAAALPQQADRVEALIGEAKAALLEAGFARIDYLALADAQTLQPLSAYEAGRPMRLLVAAHLGRTRLIDNFALPAHD